MQGMDSGIVVLIYEPCPSLLRTPSGFYESLLEGHGVGVRSSAVGKVVQSERASRG